MHVERDVHNRPDGRGGCGEEERASATHVPHVRHLRRRCSIRVYRRVTVFAAGRRICRRIVPCRQRHRRPPSRHPRATATTDTRRRDTVVQVNRSENCRCRQRCGRCQCWYSDTRYVREALPSKEGSGEMDGRAVSSCELQGAAKPVSLGVMSFSFQAGCQFKCRTSCM